MTSADMQAIRARAEAATPGPWQRSNTSQITVFQPDGQKTVIGQIHAHDDKVFVCESRNDALALCDRIGQLEHQLDRLCDLIADWDEDIINRNSKRRPMNGWEHSLLMGFRQFRATGTFDEPEVIDSVKEI